MTHELAVLSQIVGRWDVGSIAILIVVVAAVIALVYIALSKFGVAIPDWVVQIFWVLVVAFVVIGAEMAEQLSIDHDKTQAIADSKAA